MNKYLQAKKTKKEKKEKIQLHLLHSIAKMQRCIQGRLIVNTIVDGVFKRNEDKKCLGMYLFGESHKVFQQISDRVFTIMLR